MVHLRALCQLRNVGGLLRPDGSKSPEVFAGDEFMASEADAVRHVRRKQAERVAPKPAKKTSKKAAPKEG